MVAGRIYARVHRTGRYGRPTSGPKAALRDTFAGKVGGRTLTGVMVVLGWMLFLPLTLNPRPLGRFYSAQLEALLQGRLNVAPADHPSECFLSDDGLCYGYYGVTPSVLRLIFLPAGLAADYSIPMILAAAFVVIAMSGLIVTEIHEHWHWRLVQRDTTRSDGAQSNVPLFIGLLAVIPGISLFSVIPFHVYEEAVMWCAALSLVSIWLMLIWLRTMRWPLLVGVVLASVGAASSRPGGALLLPVLAAGLLLLLISRARGTHPKCARTLWLWLAVPLGALPLVVMSIVFFAKFGEPVPDPSRHTAVPEHPFYAEMYSVNGNRYFHPQYAPTQIATYLRPDALRLSFADGVGLRLTTSGGVGFPDGLRISLVERRPVILVTDSPTPSPVLWPLDDSRAMVIAAVPSLWLVAGPACLLTLVAFFGAFTRRYRLVNASSWFDSGPQSLGLLPLFLLAASAAVTLPLLLQISAMVHYSADFIPLVVLGSAMGATCVNHWMTDRRWRSIATLIGLVILGSTILLITYSYLFNFLGGGN